MNQTPPNTNRVRIRIAALVAFLACESIAYAIVRSVDWSGIAGLLATIAAFAIAGLPLVVALAVLIARGRRFTLRGLLVATGLIAVFMAMVLFPITRARQRRIGVQVLQDAGIYVPSDRGSPSGPAKLERSNRMSPDRWLESLRVGSRHEARG